MPDLIFEDESYIIRGACYEVYKDKGHGFLESVYQECMEIELADREVPFVAQPRLSLKYKSRKLNSEFVPDLICFEKIIVELKAVKNIDDSHRAQLLNYLKATDMKLGLIVNFGHFPKAEIERIVR